MTRKKGYGQFCPVAKAAEVVAERWTPLILRELICGSTRFNDLRKGVPLMSPSLLSRRLKELEDAGVIERRATDSGAGSEYHLTDAGHEIQPVIEMLGAWGHRWVQHEIAKDDLDPSLLMWDVRRRVNPKAMPGDRRVVVQFDLGGVPSKKGRWWLVFDRGDVDLCLKRPGYDVDVNVAANIRTLTEIWLGHQTINAAKRAGDLELSGPRQLTSGFQKWFGLSMFAGVQ